VISRTTVSGTAKNPTPRCPQAFNNAMSSNSAMMRGRTPTDSNHSSMARRMEVRREFALFDDRVVVQAPWHLKGRFTHVVKLAMLDGEIKELTIRYPNTRAHQPNTSANPRTMISDNTTASTTSVRVSA